jgi:hypothetical protein
LNFFQEEKLAALNDCANADAPASKGDIARLFEYIRRVQSPPTHSNERKLRSRDLSSTNPSAIPSAPPNIYLAKRSVPNVDPPRGSRLTSVVSVPSAVALPKHVKKEEHRYRLSQPTHREPDAIALQASIL